MGMASLMLLGIRASEVRTTGEGNNPLLFEFKEADVSECHFLMKETIHLPLSFDLS